LIRNLQMVVISGGPHAIAWTHAGQVNRAVLNFLGAGQPTVGKRMPAGVDLPAGIEAMGSQETPDTRPTP
jgi:hypothetical protein